MKFRDFMVRRLLAGTDYLVGYNSDGEYIRVSVDDLRSSLGVADVSAQSISVQYGGDGATWHDSYTTGDVFMRIKVGSGSWSSAIRIAFSAYDIWKEAGNTGTKLDFLLSLKGEAGAAADASLLNISDMADYNDLLNSISSAINNTKSDIVNEVTAAVDSSVRSQFETVNTSENITEISALADSDYIVINTADGVRKIKTINLISNINVRTGTETSLDRVKKEQRRIIALEGEQNGSNIKFTASEAYVSGTSDLYLNGQRLVLGTDYIENNTLSITFLTQIPKSTDIIVFLAIVQ